MRSSPSRTANGSLADVLRGGQHGVAEPARVALPDVVHGGELGRPSHQREPLLVALGLERLLELDGPVEVVLERPACCGR